MSPDSREKVDHLFIVDEKLKGDYDLIYSYLSTLLTDKEGDIIEEHQKLLMAGGSDVSTNKYRQYKTLMLRFVKILLQIIAEKKYRGLLTEFIKKKYVPIEESCNLI